MSSEYPWLRLSILFRQGAPIQKADILEALEGPGPVPECAKELLLAVFTGTYKFRRGMTPGSRDEVDRRFYSELLDSLALAFQTGDFSSLPPGLAADFQEHLASGTRRNQSKGKEAAKAYLAARLGVEPRTLERFLKPAT